MSANWDDQYLTVNEIAEHLKLNPQTVRNWIDRGELPAVRVGRRVRVRRVDLDTILAKGATATLSSAVPGRAESGQEMLRLARAGLTRAYDDASQLLGRRSAVRRAELAQGLQELAQAVAVAIDLLDGDLDSEGNRTD